MLAKLKSNFTKPTTKESTNMTEATSNPADTTTSALAALTKKMAEMEANHAMMVADNAALKAFAKEVEDKNASLIAKATAARLEARTASLTAIVGTSKLDALLKATDTLPDTAFNVVVEALAAAEDKEASSLMFTEKGVAAEKDLSTETNEKFNFKTFLTKAK